ncbi:MAG: O-antigen ligase family protein [Bacteroidota bacterium]
MDIKAVKKSYTISYKQLDYVVVFSMYLLIPVDLLNGFLINNNINLTFSVAQLYKAYFLIALLLALTQRLSDLVFVFVAAMLLVLPTIVSVLTKNEFWFVTTDFVKVTRYILVFMSFLFMKKFIQNRGDYAIQKLMKVLIFSYVLIVTSIFLKYIGFGYPMYKTGNLGSRGFFSAGNEVSVLMLVVSAIIAFYIWKKKKIKLYVLFFILNLILGLAIGSKTASVGSLILLTLIPLKKPTMLTKIGRLLKVALLLIFIVPLVIFFSWEYITSSDIYTRIFYFYHKFDLITFLLSNRNTFLINAFESYTTEYSFLEQLIGVGESRYIEMNEETTVESDIFDIFFSYGAVGLALFLSWLSYLWVQFARFSKKKEKYPFANFGFLILVFLTLVSTFAGHTFSSGIAAVFIGVIFALPYYKNKNYKTN